MKPSKAAGVPLMCSMGGGDGLLSGGKPTGCSQQATSTRRTGLSRTAAMAATAAATAVLWYRGAEPIGAWGGSDASSSSPRGRGGGGCSSGCCGTPPPRMTLPTVGGAEVAGVCGGGLAA